MKDKKIKGDDGTPRTLKEWKKYIMISAFLSQFGDNEDDAMLRFYEHMLKMALESKDSSAIKKYSNYHAVVANEKGDIAEKYGNLANFLAGGRRKHIRNYRFNVGMFLVVYISEHDKLPASRKDLWQFSKDRSKEAEQGEPITPRNIARGLKFFTLSKVICGKE